MNGGTGNAEARSDEPTDLETVFEELEELEAIVDTEEERQQVRETMHVLRRAQRPRLIGRFRTAFDSRDAGEAFVGSFVFGIPMVVEEGTLEIGRFIAGELVFVVLTALFGISVVFGILHAARFEQVEADFIHGLVSMRLLGILAIATVLGVFLMTIWGRVDWTTPYVAMSQTLVAVIVMAVGAAIGDLLPES
jgi:uncharacterized membrane protein